MIPEHEIVPYQCSALPAGPWLVFAPHPDDETFGMGGSLLRAAREGISTMVAVLTDGALGGTAEGLVVLREREARAAAAFLGVAGLHFLGFPDRGLRDTDDVVEHVAALIRKSGARTVFFPGVLELHPDHRVTAQLVWRALQRNADPAVQPAAYEISVQSPVNCLVDITPFMEAKRQALRFYASQLGENNYVDVVTALNQARSFTLPPEVEYAEGFLLYGPDALASSLRELTLERTARLFPENR